MGMRSSLYFTTLPSMWFLEIHLTITWSCKKEHPSVSHHPANCGCHRCYCGGDLMILVVEEQDSIYLLTSVITILYKAHGISFSHTKKLKRRYSHFPVYPRSTPGTKQQLKSKETLLKIPVFQFQIFIFQWSILSFSHHVSVRDWR